MSYAGLSCVALHTVYLCVFTVGILAAPAQTAHVDKHTFTHFAILLPFDHF